MNNTGGRFTLDINGAVYKGRAKATLMPAEATRENGVNQDGSAWSSVKPQLVSLDLTFDRGVGLKWDGAMMLQDLNVTFVETDAKRTHLFTNAAWSGQPSLDSESGEVSGLKIECAGADYQVN